MKKIILASLLLMAGLTASAQGNFSAQANTLKLQYQKKAMTRADGAEDGTPATLYNLQGTVVAKTAVQGGMISLAGLQKGVYAVQLAKLGSTLIRK